MKWLLLIALCGSAFGTNAVFIAQNATGGNTGAECADAKAASYFNTSGNWSSTPTGIQIGPGTTVTLCGTFTGAANATMLTFQGSGASGNLLAILGDSGGVTFTAPYWNGTNAAINVNGQSNILINGGTTCGWSAATQSDTACNFVIVNTANGSASSFANQAASIGIAIPSGSSNVTIENVDIHNIYQRTDFTDLEGNDTLQNCYSLGYTGAGVQNITIKQGFCYMAGWGIQSGGPGPLTIGPGLELYAEDHNIANAAQTITIEGNHFHDWYVWDHIQVSGSYPYHHDAYHCYGNATGTTQSLYIYNNQFDGQTQVSQTTCPGCGGMNALVFLEGGNGDPTACFVNTGGGTANIFNNVAILSGPAAGYFVLSGNGNGNTSGNLANLLVANNTTLANQQSYTNASGGFAFQYASGVQVNNNAFGGLPAMIAQTNPYVVYSANPDYNFWENCAVATCWAANGISGNSFSAWQGGGNDAHGGANIASSSYFNLNSACTVGSVGQNCAPQTGSPLIGAGKNLTSLCSGALTPLCSDFAGNARPTGSTAWDVGAYQFASSPPAYVPTQIGIIIP